MLRVTEDLCIICHVYVIGTHIFMSSMDIQVWLPPSTPRTTEQPWEKLAGAKATTPSTRDHRKEWFEVAPANTTQSNPIRKLGFFLPSKLTSVWEAFEPGG